MQNASPLFFGRSSQDFYLNIQSGMLNFPSDNMKEEDLSDWLQVNAGDGSEFSSPSLPHIDSKINFDTISPQDVFPPATPMSSLMSPYLDDDSSYDVSPLFYPEDVPISGEGHWPSLFPGDASPLGEPNIDADIMGQTSEDRSTLDSSVSPSASPAVRSIGANVNTATARKGSVTGAGVRKRATPLPPIVVEDPSDHVAIKRARNTLAARKSREKKVKRMEEMEEQIEELKAQVEHWKRLCLARRV